MPSTKALWTGLLVAGLLTAGSATAAITGVTTGQGPSSAVLAYFHALARADAPAALAWAADPASDAVLPNGPPERLPNDGHRTSTAYLTSTVLRAQQQVAPMRGIHLAGLRGAAPGAVTVDVRYELGFSGAPISVLDSVAVIKRAGRWRLAQVAVALSPVVIGAPGRIALAGRPLPAAVELFPGALPISTDTAAITVTNHPYASLSGPGRVSVQAGVSPSGLAKLDAAVDAAVRECLREPTPLCPLPANDRAIPGSVRGRLTVTAHDSSATVGAAGRVSVQTVVTVTGSYQVWDFNNQAHRISGSVTVRVTATVSVTAMASVPGPAMVDFGPRR